MTMCVYILLPVHNRREITRKFINCLESQTLQNYHLILIDDGSTDGTERMVRMIIPPAKLTIIRGRGDWWWAGSLQQGINWLRGHQLHHDDVILMINDDVVVDNNFLEIAQKELLPLAGALLQAQVYCEQSGEVLDRGMVYEEDQMRFRPANAGDKVNCLTTNGLFIRWRDLRLVGDFFPRVLPHYLSDYEFTIRAGRKGLKLCIAQDLKIWWNQETTGIRHFDESSLRLFWRDYFQKKSAANPIYWSSFVLLNSHLPNIPLHLLKIWKNAFVIIARHALSAMKVKRTNFNIKE